MISILINGKKVYNTNYIARIHNIEIKTHPMLNEVRARQDAKKIADFLYSCCQKCTGIIMYNGCIIQKEDVRKWEG